MSGTVAGQLIDSDVLIDHFRGASNLERSHSRVQMGAGGVGVIDEQNPLGLDRPSDLIGINRSRVPPDAARADMQDISNLGPDGADHAQRRLERMLSNTAGL